MMTLFKYIPFVLTVLLLPIAASATETPNNIIAEKVAYKDGDVDLEGYYVPSRCGDLQESYPTVLVIHQWKGLTDNEKMRAEMLSRQCYNAFAIDMYGKDIRPKTQEEAGADSSKYKNNPKLALSRMNAALNYLNVRPHIDTENIAAIGYCFGGGMALELARSGADIKAAISFHGTLTSTIENYEGSNVKANILVHHGNEDPYVPHAGVGNFKKEMTEHKVKYEFVGYSDAVHAFTQIESGTDNSKGAAYNLNADRESWASTLKFLENEFSKEDN